MNCLPTWSVGYKVDRILHCHKKVQQGVHLLSKRFKRFLYYNPNNYIFLTHFHADFVSGHIDLAQKTGAKIVFGPTAKANYDFYEAKDGEVFELGNVKLTNPQK